MRIRRITTIAIALTIGAAGTALSASQAMRQRTIAAARERIGIERRIRDEDIAFYARRASEDPQSAEDRARLAALYLQRARETGDWSNYTAAERAARDALALRTGRNGKSYLVLASSLLARHEFRQAFDVARDMVALAPDEPAYRALLAELQVELGDYDAARASFDTLRADARHPAVAPRLARWLELTGRREAAEAVLREALKQSRGESALPAEQRAWFALRVGDFYLRNGRVEEGLRVARAALREAPGDERLMLLVARGAALNGAWREAIRQVEAAGGRADIASLALAGDAAAALGDSSQARVWWDRAERRGHEQPEPFNRQWTLFRLEHGIALADTRALLEREIATRRDVYGWDQLALARLAVGDTSGAQAAMAEALRLGTRDAVLWWHSALVAAGAGHAAEAHRRASRALELNPRFHHRDAGRAREMLAAP